MPTCIALDLYEIAAHVSIDKCDSKLTDRQRYFLRVNIRLKISP